MKILLLKSKQEIDYMSDSIYHGLITSNHNVYLANNYFDYMYKWFVGDIINRRYTLYKTLDGYPNILEIENIIDLIHNKFFDKIIISDIRDYKNYYNDFQLCYYRYKKKDIHLIDGKDDYFILSGLSDFGTLWKRELRNKEANPISFAVPEEKLITHTPTKLKLFAIVVPGDIKTYIFEDEESYYNDYKISYYGKTWKKGGWDCLRHYEILANGCIPYFPDLENCPTNTMVNFPKEIIKETNEYAKKSLIPHNYNQINEQLLNYTRENLTTKALASKIIHHLEA